MSRAYVEKPDILYIVYKKIEKIKFEKKNVGGTHFAFVHMLVGVFGFTFRFAEIVL